MVFLFVGVDLRMFLPAGFALNTKMKRKKEKK